MKTDESFGIVPCRLSQDGSNYEFLLIHQRLGHWAFPKGHREGSESDVEAARRELFEETGIANVTLINGYSYTQSYIFEQNGEKIDKKVFFYLGVVDDTDIKIKDDEVQAYGWYGYDNALEKLTFEDSKVLLKDAFARIMREDRVQFQ